MAKPKAFFTRSTIKAVAGRTRQSIAKHIGNDNEPTAGVENTIGTNQPLNVVMLRSVRSWVEDDIAALL
ncbi:hypothetical protein [Scytonema sp. UIC 10036]|uniref:hypothetical protein n=1 Tax=Scytonema sp. UIC 10036 TaxID=2304196 RepID=UPI001A9A7F67|nr:hypothetical protein [Scytonema sp. UIC 10036]